MNNKNKPLTETYKIAQTWKRLTARIFDVIIVSIIPLVIGLGIYLGDKTNQEWWKIMLVFIINIVIVTIYFVIVPWKWHGRTLGKLILQIKLVNDNNENLTLKQLFYREMFLVFIPLGLTMGIILFLRLTFNINIVTIKPNNTLNFWINILIRIVVSFDFAWYCGIMIVTKIDKYHQLFYDRRAKTYVINKNPIIQKINVKQKKHNEPHIHLVFCQPGNISDDELENIHNL
ncbi:RDD family protein [Spiroplasma endosymbiont of Nebria brevicollis]|uniref:RDD family protein n=1 Tax=Spiroplasma endosymbiont of Nebria brevicollis TaxID=3066284 RepID=UPI00313E3960